jgi:hypothetical protein
MHPLILNKDYSSDATFDRDRQRSFVFISTPAQKFFGAHKSKNIIKNQISTCKRQRL